MELFLIFVTLIQHFQFEMAPDCPDLTLEPRMKTTLVPREYRLVVKTN